MCQSYVEYYIYNLILCQKTYFMNEEIDVYGG